MKRVRISVGILLLMIGISVFFNYRISVNCDKLIEIVETVEDNVRNNNKSEALENAYQFEESFTDFHTESLMMIRGDKLSEVENCYVRIVPLIETDNNELLPELIELKNILIHLKKSELPMLSNIL